MFTQNTFIIKSKGKFTVVNREGKRDKFIEWMYVFSNLLKNADFQEKTQALILYIYYIITVYEISYVLIKIFNVCGDNFKFLLFFFSYEGYVAFIIDLIILFVSIVSRSTLNYFTDRVEELEQSNCFDEDTEA